VRPCWLYGRNPTAKFLIIGDGELRAKLVALVERLGLASAFRFVGHREDVCRWIASLDLAVTPSLWEGLPYSLLEAMALAKAVVATNVGGVPEAVVPESTGILVPANAPEPLAAAIVELLGDPRGEPRWARPAGRAWSKRSIAAP